MAGPDPVLGHLRGRTVGRARGYSDDQKRSLDHIIHNVVVEEFGATNLPIVSNMDFGHTDPQWILPLGVNAELDPTADAFRLLEPATE